MNPPFGKQPNVWAAVGAGSGGVGCAGPFTDYPVFKAYRFAYESGPSAGTQTFGTSTANDFPGGDIDAGGNIYAVWCMNNAERTSTQFGSPRRMTAGKLLRTLPG